MVTRARVRLSGWTLTTRGRKNSLTDACMGFVPRKLLGIELDDQVFVDVGQDFFAVRQLLEHAAHLLLVDVDPLGETGLDHHLQGVLHPQLLPGLFADRDFLTGADLEGRNVHDLAIDGDALVAHQLARLRPGGGKAHPVGDVVQATLEQLQQVLAGGALLLGGALVVVVELAFQDSVHAAQLLLLAQLQTVVRNARATLGSAAGRHLEFALGLERTDAALEKQVRALPAGELALRSEISSHSSKPLRSDAPLLGRTTAIMGNRGHVLDVGHAESHRVQRADGRFATRAGALDAHFDVLDAVLRRGVAGLLGGDLRGERRALARTTKTATAGGGPGQRVALAVRDRDDRVVERGVDVRNGVHHLLLDLFAHPGGLLGHALLPHGTTRTLPRPCVGARALPAQGQPAAMTNSPVTAEVHQSLDVHGILAAQVALHRDTGHFGTQAFDLRFRQVANLGVRRNAGGFANLLRTRIADPENMGQRDHCVLVGWDVDPGNTGH